LGTRRVGLGRAFSVRSTFRSKHTPGLLSCWRLLSRSRSQSQEEVSLQHKVSFNCPIFLDCAICLPTASDGNISQYRYCQTIIIKLRQYNRLIFVWFSLTGLYPGIASLEKYAFKLLHCYHIIASRYLLNATRCRTNGVTHAIRRDEFSDPSGH